ncbi:MAG: hypothetical protein RRB13_12785 [bacterium]|nr:hypothetical protein [bacterium]
MHAMALSSFKARVLGWAFGALCLLLPSHAGATQGMLLTQFDPELQTAAAYHTFERGLLLLAFERRNPDHFTCEGNRYFLYDAQNERMAWFEGGNLLVSGDFKRLVYLKTRRLEPVQPSAIKRFEAQAQRLVEELQVSPGVLQAAASEQDGRRCWQQPVLVPLGDLEEQPLPYLAENLCEKRWCSELYFEQPDQLRLWLRLSPKEVSMVRLDFTDGAHRILKKGAPFHQPELRQQHMARENLLAGKDIKNLQLPLAGGRRLILRQERGGRVSMTLLRKEGDGRLAKVRLKEAQDLLKQDHPRAAFTAARLSSWLNPVDTEARYLQLQALAAYEGTGAVFELMDQEFKGSEKDQICQRLHLDDRFKRLKQQPLFFDQFAQSCPKKFSPNF